MALPVTYVAGQVLEAQQLNDSFDYVYPGVQYVASASFTNVASVSMPAGTFTTDYNFYSVIFMVTDATASAAVGMQVNNAGTPRTGASYTSQYGYAASNGFNNLMVVNGGTSWNIGSNDSGGDSFNTNFTVYEPANASVKTRFIGPSNSYTPSGYSSGTAGGIYGTAEANDGLTFVSASGNITGKWLVMGWVNS